MMPNSVFVYHPEILQGGVFQESCTNSQNLDSMHEKRHQKGDFAIN